MRSARVVEARTPCRFDQVDVVGSLFQGGSLANYVLRLFVTGTSPRAEVAVANLRRICEQELQGRYELQVIDVLEQPQLAEDEKVLATPTLIKQLPPPLRRVIGDLSDKDKVLLGLEVRPAALADSDPKPKKK
ncbi:MAG: circadian clock protein KaiB [Gemmatimonadetes bacterium]|jgi:circadian clock protein KaiB|nr:MAG: circadian clock protein KaiB [Gemmatimonadota bacterium]